MLDAFKPENKQDVARLDEILVDTHEHFKALVRARRQNALKEDDEVFSGAFWTAPKARQRGLIDGIGHLADFMEARFGEDVKLKKATEPTSMTRRLMGARAKSGSEAKAEASGGELAALAETLEARALWARYGL